jgi:hypothetical protein
MIRLSLSAQACGHDDEHCQPENGKEDQPFQPNGFLLIFNQRGPDIENDDAQAVDDMEERAEENEDLENPILVNRIDENSGVAAELLREKTGDDMEPDKDRDAQTRKPVEDPSPHRSSPLILESRKETNMPLKSHTSLLLQDRWVRIITYYLIRRSAEKVTMFMDIWFQTSFNKEGRRLYNP